MRSRLQEHLQRMTDIKKAIHIESAIDAHSKSVNHTINILNQWRQKCRECNEPYCLHCYDKHIH